MTERQKRSLQWDEYLLRKLIIGHVKCIIFVQGCIAAMYWIVAGLAYLASERVEFYLLPVVMGTFLVVQLINLCMTYFEEKP